MELRLSPVAVACGKCRWLSTASCLDLATDPWQISLGIRVFICLPQLVQCNGNGLALRKISVDHDEAVSAAQKHGSGDSSLFSSALGFLSDNKVGG